VETPSSSKVAGVKRPDQRKVEKKRRCDGSEEAVIAPRAVNLLPLKGRPRIRLARGETKAAQKSNEAYMGQKNKSFLKIG